MENEEKRAEWRKQRFEELNNLEIDESFSVPAGFYIPFGFDVIIKEAIQGELKTKSGIISSIPTSRTVGASIGQIYAIGELVTKPIFEGMKVYYEPQTMLRVYINGEEYVQVAEHNVFGAVTPSSHLQPYVADFVARRREKRIDGTKAVMKHDNEEFNKKVDIHENSGKKQFAVTKEFKKD